MKSDSIPPTPQAPLDVRTVVLTFLGFCYLAMALPPTALTVGSTVLWYFVDPITPNVVKFIGRKLEPLWAPMFRNKEDAFIMNVVILQAFIQPAIFAYALYLCVTNNAVPFFLAYVYHLIRIGPYFMNFAYAYTLCHKEGHTRMGMFKNDGFFLGNVFNWWIGLFYGVMPSSFAYGHSRNHHRYNNEEKDVISTWDRPRDSFLNYVRYVPRWVAYSLNITAVIQFYEDGDNAYITKMIRGSMGYFAFYFMIHKVNAVFAVVFLLYPFLESTLLLSAINWAWHCFLDPDVSNNYASSITIFEGDERTNILNEDYHVVHHQYPGAHWTAHPKLYEKHKADYADNRATAFVGTHAMEIFFLAILKKYDVFLEKFVDISGKMTEEEKRELLVTRLRTCCWGELKNTTDKTK